MSSVRIWGVVASLLAAMSAARAGCATWLPGAGVAGVNGTIYACTVWDADGDGPAAPMLVVGGQFTFAGTTAAANIASWDGEQWRALGAGLTSSTATPAVYTLAVHEGKLVAGGVFTITTPGGSWNNVAAWDGMTWTSMGGLGNQVNALCVHKGKLVAGGLFAAAVAEFNGATWQAVGGGVSDGLGTTTVNALASDGERLYVGGKFLLAGGVSVSNIAAWNGANWDGLNFGVAAKSSDPGVLTLACAGRDVIVGGGFTYPGGNEASNIALWNGVYWETMSAISGWVYDVFAESGEVWAATASGISKWNGWVWTPMPWSGGATIRRLARYGASLYAVGSFGLSAADGYVGIARWSGSQWQQVTAGLARQPVALVVLDNRVYAGFGESPAGTGLLCWDGNVWLDPFAGAPNYWSSVSALGTHQGELIAAGRLVTRSGALPTRSIVARWRGGQWERLGASGESNGTVQVLMSYNGNLIAGGDFISVDLQSATRIARWDGAAWRAMGGVNGTVRCLGEFQGSLIVGGTFSTAGTVTTARNIAAWTLAQGFRAMGNGFDNTVRALATMDGVLYAGGAFARTGTTLARSVASWNGTAWVGVPSVAGDVYGLSVNKGLVVVGSVVPTGLGSPGIARYSNGAWSGFGSGTSGSPTLIANYAGEVVIGGTVSSVGGQASWGFARWTDTGVAPVLESPRSVDAACGASVEFRVRASSGYAETTYAWRRNGTAISGNPSAATPVLRWAGITHAEDGAYDCVVGTSCGQAVSGAGVLVSTCCPADLNFDGLVNDADFGVFAAAYNLLLCTDTAMPLACPADLNRDGAVDDADFGQFLGAYDALECP